MCSLLKQNACFVTVGTFWWLFIICSKLIIFIKTPQEYKCAQVTNGDVSLFKMPWPTVLIHLTSSVSKFTVFYPSLVTDILQSHISLNPESQEKPPKCNGKFWRTTGKIQSLNSWWKYGYCSYFTEIFCSTIDLNEFHTDAVEACFRDVSFQQVPTLCWKSQTLKSPRLP